MYTFILQKNPEANDTGCCFYPFRLLNKFWSAWSKYLNFSRQIQ